jgi:phosphoglycolate phosphatase
MSGVAISQLSTSNRYNHVSSLRPCNTLTIFCDFDGPIVDVSDRYYQTYQLALADITGSCKASGYRSPIRLLTKAQFWQMKQERVPDVEIALRSGLHHEQIEGFLKRVHQIVNQPVLLNQDRLQPGVKWALSLLHAQGATLVLVTLRCQNQAIQILQSYGLLNLFSAVRGVQDHQAAYGNSSEQKTQLLANVLEEAAYRHVQPKSAWMIGDTEADILAGQTAGLPTVALTCGIRSQTYLEQFQPSRIHQDLLSAAHYLVSQRVVL